MAYTGNKLVVRPAYSGIGGFQQELGDFWDSVKELAGSVVKGYGDTRAAQGANDALSQQAAAQAALAAQTGPSTMEMALIGGGLLLGAALILKKRKK